MFICSYIIVQVISACTNSEWIKTRDVARFCSTDYYYNLVSKSSFFWISFIQKKMFKKVSFRFFFLLALCVFNILSAIACHPNFLCVPSSVTHVYYYDRSKTTTSKQADTTWAVHWKVRFQVILSIMTNVGSIISTATVHRFGKRFLTLWTLSINATLLFTFGAYIIAVKNDYIKSSPWIALTILCSIYLIGSCGISCISWMLLIEIFPNK